MNQSSTILSAFGSRMGIWHNSGAWGPLGMALSFPEASKDKVLHSCPLSFGYLYEGVIPWGGGLAYHEGSQSKGKSWCADWSGEREREPVSLVVLWTAEVTYHGTVLTLSFSSCERIPPLPLFKPRLVEFSLTCNWMHCNWYKNTFISDIIWLDSHHQPMKKVVVLFLFYKWWHQL